MKKIALILLAVFVALAMSSCATKTKVETVTTLDISQAVKALYATRPATEYKFVTEIQSVDDIVTNSLYYIKAWEDWEIYALNLESFLDKLTLRLDSSANSL